MDSLFLIQVPDWPESAPQHRPRDTLGIGPPKTKSEDDSATENSDDEQPMLEKPAPSVKTSSTRSPVPSDRKKVDHSTSSSEPPKEAQRPTKKIAVSDSSPPPARPPVTKKAKRVASSPSNSEESDEAAAGPSTRRGARQPIKRGGRRF